MTEQWRNELTRIQGLHPDEDLLERASERPRLPDTPPRAASRLAIIGGSLLLVAAFVYGGFVALGGTRSVPFADEGVGPPEAPVRNGELLYAKYAGGGWKLFAVDPATERERQVTHGGYRDYGSDWSPDGTKIVYDSETGGGDSNIVVAEADGSDPLTLGPGAEPTWSPDGSRIAFVGEGGAIWVMDAGGGGARPITDGPATEDWSDWSPTWSPDGGSIAYTSGSGETSSGYARREEIRIWSDADGSDTLLTDAYKHVDELDWSPDGTSILFTGERAGADDPDVGVLSVVGGSSTFLTEGAGWDSGATWSPDGRWIAYVDGPQRIVVMRSDGSDRRVLAVVERGVAEIIGLSWGVSTGE